MRTILMNTNNYNFIKIPTQFTNGKDQRFNDIQKPKSILIYLILSNAHVEFLQWSFTYNEIVNLCIEAGFSRRINMLLKPLLNSGLVAIDRETESYYLPDILILQDETMQTWRNDRYQPHRRAKKTEALKDKKFAQWLEHPRGEWVTRLTGRPELPYATPKRDVALILSAVVDTNVETESDPLPEPPAVELDQDGDNMELNPFHNEPPAVYQEPQQDITEIPPTEIKVKTPKHKDVTPAETRNVGQEVSTIAPAPEHLTDQQKDRYYIKTNPYNGELCNILGRMHIRCHSNGSPLQDRKTGTPITCNCTRQDIPQKEKAKPRFDAIAQDIGAYDPLHEFEADTIPETLPISVKVFQRPQTPEYKDKKKAPTKISTVLKDRYMSRRDA